MQTFKQLKIRVHLEAEDAVTLGLEPIPPYVVLTLLEGEGEGIATILHQVLNEAATAQVEGELMVHFPNYYILNDRY